MQINMRLNMKSKLPHAYDYFIYKNKCIISILIENWYALPKPFVVLSQTGSKKDIVSEFYFVGISISYYIFSVFASEITLYALKHERNNYVIVVEKICSNMRFVMKNVMQHLLRTRYTHGHHNIANPLVRLCIENSVSSWD